MKRRGRECMQKRKRKPMSTKNFDHKLNVGDKFRAIGCVLLKGINEGQTYEITSAHKPDFGRSVYGIKRILKSGELSKKSWGHYVDVIDSCFNPLNNNRLVLVEFGNE